MIIVIQVKAPMHMAQGIKEHLAHCVERFGDTRVLEIKPEKPERIEQMYMGGIR